MRLVQKLAFLAAPFSLTAHAAVPSASTEQARMAEPSEAFRTFVANLAIMGAKDGHLLVDHGFEKRLYRIGDVIDSKIGVKLSSITFESGEAVIVFQEKTGALLSRKIAQK